MGDADPFQQLAAADNHCPTVPDIRGVLTIQLLNVCNRLCTTIWAFGLAGLTGFLGAAFHVPLAWMLGPLIVAASLSAVGFTSQPNEGLRKFGQIAIGTAVGLTMTTKVLVELGGWLPFMLISAIFFVLAFCVAGDRTNPSGRILATSPGGLSEMTATTEILQLSVPTVVGFQVA